VNRIAFIGVGGNSANLVREGATRFFRLGIPSEAHADGWFQRMLASTLRPGDVVFAISSSGTPAELIDSLAIASQYGAGTVALTRAGSPAAVKEHLRRIRTAMMPLSSRTGPGPIGD